jgi:hypothetical protein
MDNIRYLFSDDNTLVYKPMPQSKIQEDAWTVNFKEVIDSQGDEDGQEENCCQED